MNKFSLYCWEGYEVREILGKFAESRGLHVESENLTSDSEASSRVILGKAKNPSILNINNPFPRKRLFPAKRIHALDRGHLPEWTATILPWTKSLCEWGYSDTGELIGIPQRFGPFNFVINTTLISQTVAENEGFCLLATPKSAPKYGLLVFPEFNVFHIALSLGLNPFSPLSKQDKQRFEFQAQQWFDHAAYISDDCRKLNTRLTERSISMIMSAGMFSSGYLRREGFHEIYCITPKKGPMGGNGGICFVELNTIPVDTPSYADSIEFLEMILSPTITKSVISNQVNCNPIVQMGDRRIFDELDPDLLEALQWDTLEEDLARCVEYDLPPDFDELLGIVNTTIKQSKDGRWL